MANNKVVLNNETLIDISTDTVNPEVVLDGYTFHDKNGDAQTGTYVDGPESTVNWMLASILGDQTVGNQTVYDTDYGNEYWCALAASNGIIRSLTNGISWELTSQQSSAANYTIMYANGVWNACLYPNGMYYSENNGADWTQNTFSSAPDTRPIAYVNGYWFVKSDSTGSWYSSNGINMTDTGLGIMANLFDVDYRDGIWVAATSSGIRYSTAPPPTSWQPSNQTAGYFSCIKVSLPTAERLFVAGSSNLGLMWSDDGITWNASNITSAKIKKVETNGSSWVAVGEIGILQSDDGKEWSIVETATSFNDIVYTNGKWVACSAGYGLYDSADGKSWVQSNIASGTFYNVKAKNGRFIACGTSGIYYASI